MRFRAEAYATVLGFPVEVGGAGDAVLAAELLDGNSRIRLLEDRNDLGFGEPRLFLQSFQFGLVGQKTLLLTCQPALEAYDWNRN